MLVLFLAACDAGDDNGFLSGSGRYENSAWGITDTADTADTGGGGGGGGGGGEGAPVLSDVKLEWSDYPNYGIVLLIEVAFTDEGDDIVGGVVYADIFQPGDELAYSGVLEIVDIAEVEEQSPETAYYLDDETLFFAVDNLDETEDSWLTIEAKDASGNVSSTTEASIDGA
ncbi:MAG: hypothetical protein FJ090_17330 [Deltaproteobacteria bacterium]|nr:hypothetical protein [Deltaproteobacteria bacterium]